MGSKKVPYDVVVSGRITAQDKALMDKYNISVRDAVKTCLMGRGNEKEKLKIKKEYLMDEINNLKMDLIAAEMQLSEINDKMAVLDGGSING